ncbi:hypothetical protein OAF75_00775 [Verrucomicrobiales bacterium]|nr:hypothetical protein [Verrucomicrobiales bacterium]
MNWDLYYQAKKEAQALRFLADVPQAGEGVHQAIGDFTNEVGKLKLWEDNNAYVIQLVLDAVADCGRSVSEFEVEDFLRRARNYWSNPPKKKRPKEKPYPKYEASKINDLEKIEKVSLINSSPVKELGSLEPIDLITELFPPVKIYDDPMVCVGRNKSYIKNGKEEPYQKFRTRPINEHERDWVNKSELVCSCYMAAQYGVKTDASHKEEKDLTKDDLSEHTADNCGDRAYLIIENDKVDKTKQERILHHFSKKLPLALIVDSGGKSLHGWFNCYGKQENKVLDILREACVHGADLQMRLKVQFCRLPNGIRNSNGNKQSVLYYNPDNAVKEGS